MAANFQIKFTNLEEVKKALVSAPQIAVPKFDKAIKRSIYEIKRNTVPITPVDTGRLRGSIGAGIQFTPLRGRIGSNLVYARPQHEREDFRHSQGEAKYLEKGANRSIKFIEDEFKSAAQETFDEIARRAN